MIYSRTEEIILLYSSDGRATLHDPETMRNIPTTAKKIERWQKWFDIINESDNNESLILAIEHAEAIYGLCRER
jgi:2-keto-3-deoxy-L-rhamnonate aldolase RhmA